MKYAVMILIPILWTAPVLADDSASFALAPISAQVALGEYFQVEVSIDSDEFVNLGDLALRFDPTVLSLVEVDNKSSRFSFDAVEEIDNDAGTLHLILGEPHATAPKGENLSFATLKFQVIGSKEITEITVQFSGTGADGDSAIYKDDGVPTDILSSVQSTSVEIHLPSPRASRGRKGN